MKKILYAWSTVLLIPCFAWGQLPQKYDSLYKTIFAKDFCEMLQKNSDIVLLDVRSPGEWKKGHVPGASHIFVPELGKRVGELDRNKPTAVYCGSGYRASIATSILKRQGFNDLWNVPGSWEAWKKAKLPVEGADGK